MYQLITRRRFDQMAVLEGQNILVTISGRKRRIRVYYLSWLKQKILHTDGMEKRNGWVNVGDLEGAVHFKIVKYERIKFLVVGLEASIEIYAWAPKPYHKFMAFKSFGSLTHPPLIVDLTVEEQARLKVPSSFLLPPSLCLTCPPLRSCTALRPASTPSTWTARASTTSTSPTTSASSRAAA